MGVYKFYINAIACFFVLCQMGYAENTSTLRADNFYIPSKYGSVIEKYSGGAEDKFVVFIQDIHKSRSAQKNMADIIGYLSKDNRFGVVGLEGAENLINTDELSGFPDSKTKETVCDYFMAQGNLSGAEYHFLVNNDSPLKLFGVEDRPLYKVNLNSYLCALSYQKDFDSFINFIQDKIETLKPEVYSSNMLAFDLAVRPFHNNEKDYLDYCADLIYNADLNLVDYENHVNLVNLMKVMELENKIDFNRAEVERSFAVGELRTMLDEEQAGELMEKELAFKTSTLPAENYMVYLAGLFKDNELDLNEYSTLKNFMDYIILSSGVSHKELLNETRQLEHDIYNSFMENRDQIEHDIYNAFVRNPDQEKLYSICRYIDLLGKLSGLQMSRQLIKEYRLMGESINIQSVVSYIYENTEKQEDEPVFDIDSIKADISHYEEFYKMAFLREQKMAGNLIGFMDSHNIQAGMLVAGGFHSEGLKEEFRANNVSYAVIKPASGNETTVVPYLSLLSDYKTPLEQFIASHISTLKVASWLSDTPLAFEDRHRIMTTKMKTLLTTTTLFDLYSAVSPGSITQTAEKMVHIENRLKESINNIITAAGYASFIRVTNIEVKPDEVIAELQFFYPDGTPSASIVVRAYDNTRENFVDTQTGTALLETVRLNTGVTQEFINQAGYSDLRFKDNLVQAQILHDVFASPKNIDVLMESLERSFPDMVISENQVKQVLNDLVEAGLVTEKTLKSGEVKFRSNSRNPARETVSHLVNVLISKNAAGIGPQQYDMISFDLHHDLSPANKIKYNYLMEKVSKIIIDPTIPFTEVNEFMNNLLEQSKKAEKKAAELDLSIFNNQFKVIELADPSSVRKMICISTKFTDEDELNILDNPAQTESADWYQFTERIDIPKGTLDNLHITEADLWDLVAADDEWAENILFDQYSNLVPYVCNKMFFMIRNSRYHKQILSFEDMKAFGNIGLINAIRYYNPATGVPFKVYACTAIRNEIRRNLTSSSWIGKSVFDQIVELNRAIRYLTNLFWRVPEDDEIADYMNTSVQKIENLKEIKRLHFVSINKPVKYDSETSLLDLLPDIQQSSPLDMYEAKERNQMILDAVAFLSKREQEILRLSCIEELNNRQLGSIYGLSHAGISVIYLKAVQKLKTLVDMRTSLKKEDIQELSLSIRREFNALTPVEKEMIYLSVSGDFTDEQIAKMLNRDNHIYLREERSAVYSRILQGIMDKTESPRLKTFLDENETSFNVIIKPFIHNRNDYILDILEDMVLRSVETNLDLNEVRDIFKDYNDFYTPFELEIILLYHYETFTTSEIGEMLDLSQPKVADILKKIHTRTKNIMNVRSEYPAEIRQRVSKLLLNGLNELPLKSRNIMLDLLYEGFSRADISKKYDIQSATVSTHKFSCLKKLREYMLSHILSDRDIPFLPFKFLMGSDRESLYLFENFVSGLIFDIRRDEISKNDLRPPKGIEDVLNKVALEKIYVDLDKKFLRDILKEYAAFLSDHETEVLLMRYKDGLTFPQIAQATGRNVNTLASFEYRTIMPRFSSYLRFYQTLNRKDLNGIRRKLANAITTLFLREIHIMVYYAYDDLSDDEIAEVLGISTHMGNHKRKVQMAIRKLKDILVSEIEDEEVLAYFDGNPEYQTYIRYLLRGLKYEIPRSTFNVPELNVSEIETEINDFYSFDYLKTLYGKAGFKNEPAEQDLKELSALLDTFSDQQFDVLYLQYGKKLPRKEAAAILDISLESVDSVTKACKRKIKKHFKFLEQFNQDELSQLREALAEALDQILLPPEKKIILIHAFFDNLSYRQSALQLGVDESQLQTFKSNKIWLMKRLQKEFLKRIESDKHKDFFSGNVNNMTTLLGTLKAQVPRERFGLPESALGRKRAGIKEIAPQQKTAEQQPENVIKDENTDPEELGLIELDRNTPEKNVTPLKANVVFEHFGEVAGKKMMKYLDLLAKGYDVALPNPLVVNRNNIFSELRDRALSSSQIDKYLRNSTAEFGLSEYQVSFLRYVLEKVNYVEPHIADTDVIILDLDSLNISSETSTTASTGFLRNELLEYMRALTQNYRKQGRKANFVLYSTSYNMIQLESFFGTEFLGSLTQNGNRVYSKDLLDYFISSDKSWSNFFFDLYQQYGVGRVNFKMFSQNNNHIDIAKTMGFVLGDSRASMFQSLQLFSMLHPGTTTPNVYIKGEKYSLEKLMSKTKQGYFSLSGKEIYSTNRVKFIRFLNRRRIIDSAA